MGTNDANPKTTMTTAHAIRNQATPAGIERSLREVREHLHDMKRRLDEEIRRYPTPIPRCDAQFNHLFEQRARLSRGLERLDALTAVSRAESIELLGEFARSPTYLDESAEAELRARVASELSG